MRYSYVEAFRAVMLSGSTTAAARILHTSQPNVSRSISQLEKLTGLRLFDRSPGKVVPTSDGLAFFDEVQRSFLGMQQLEQAAKRIQRFSGGILRVASVPTLASSLIPKTIKRFAAAYPDTTVSIHAGHSSAVWQWVDERSCHLGIVSHVNERYGFFEEELYAVDGVCIMPASHPLATKKVMRPADLKDERYISFAQNDLGRSDVDSVFDEAGVSRTITLETPYSLIICALVAQGLGVAIVSPIIAREHRHLDLVARPFLPSIKHAASVIRPAGRPEDRLASCFVEILRTVVSEELAALTTKAGLRGTRRATGPSQS